MHLHLHSILHTLSNWPTAPRPRALGRLPTNQQPTKQPNSHQNSSKIDEKSSKNLFPRVSWRGSGGHVGLKNRSWEASWGGLGAILGPRANQDPQGWGDGPPRASLGPPNLEPKSNINQHKIKQKNDHFLISFLTWFFIDFIRILGPNMGPTSTKNL